MKITRTIFESQRERRFGTANPERMPLAFWEWMVRGAEDARIRDDSTANPNPAILGHSPYAVRRFFGEEGDYSAGPIWNFERMGATRTPHPDGRMICIGGEHEDDYDPDFCIYNDVVVIDLDGSVTIFGYPTAVFPPTDFHTASLSGERIIIVGRLGYADERRPARRRSAPSIWLTFAWKSARPGEKCQVGYSGMRPNTIPTFHHYPGGARSSTIGLARA